MTASEKLQRIIAGTIAGCAIWMLIAWLSIPHIFGAETYVGLVPAAALCGVLSVTRLHKWVLYAAAALFFFALTVAYTPLFVAPARSLIRSDALSDSADAVVVLSAGLTPDGYISRDGLERLLSGLELIKLGAAPTLVVTREMRKVGDSVVRSDSDQQRIASLANVREIISTPRVRNTHDEAVAVAAIAKSRGWHRVVVVTNPFHTKRACATFEKAGLLVTCRPSRTRDIVVSQLYDPQDRVDAFGFWLYEKAGTLRYRQLGWL